MNEKTNSEPVNYGAFPKDGRVEVEPETPLPPPPPPPKGGAVPSKDKPAKKKLSKAGRPDAPETFSADKSPVFGSMQQCAAIAHVPISMQQTVKKLGCPAFHASSRVALYPLLDWIFNNDKAQNLDWGKHREKFQALNEEEKYKRASEQSLDKDSVASGITKVIGLLFNNLDRLANSSLPPVLKHLDEKQVQKHLVDAHEKLKEAVRQGLLELVAPAKQVKEE